MIFLIEPSSPAYALNGRHDEYSAYNWYCKRMKDHARPDLDTPMKFIEDEGCACYYIGKNPDEKVLYLTFDAGYENGNIERVLDALKAENVHAAFFVLENLITSDKELVQRMIDEGHLVCNHTMKHRDMTKVTEYSTFEKELTGLETIYRDTMGAELSKYYRPPEGRFSESNLRYAAQLGYKTILWSFAYADWDNNNQPSPEAAAEKILSNTHNGAVILLHPTSKTNADILPSLIREWKSQGYSFGTLDQLCAG